MTTQLFQSGGVQTTVLLPQIIYLDFDGELTSYNGEILTVDNVTVEDSGLTEERIAAITATLNQQFRDQNVEFVTEKPASGDYSTIFVGKTSSFALYGSFEGLAETVDSGNTIHNDNAFVMLDSLSSDDRIADVIAHEAGHLLGTLDHGGEGLTKYAKDYSVSNGVTSTGVLLNAGDSMYVSSGGTANSTTVNSGGSLRVESCGLANRVVINSGGTLGVARDGTANNVVWTPCIGTVLEKEGAVVNYVSSYSGVYFGKNDELLISAMALSDSTLSGDMYVMSGGVINNITFSDGYINVSSGGTANNTILSSYLYVYRGGMAEGTVVKSGSIQIYSQGVISSTVVSNGHLDVRMGGLVSDTDILSGGSIWASSGGIIAGKLQIQSGACVSACQGAVIDFTVSEQSVPSVALINDWSLIEGRTDAVYTLTVSADQAYGTYCLAGGASNFNKAVTVKTAEGNILGTIWVGDSLKSETALYQLNKNNSVLSLDVTSPFYDAVQLCSSGTLVSSAQVMTGEMLGAGGNNSMCVSRGGTANSTTVNSGGSMKVAFGGVANDTTINSGGELIVSNGYDAYDYSSSGGSSFRTYVKNGGVLRIGNIKNLLDKDAASATSNMISSGGSMVVYGFGSSIDTTVYSGGSVTVLADGHAVNNTLDGGRMWLEERAYAFGNTILSCGGLFVGFGSLAETITVGAGGGVYVMGGGEIKGNITVSQDGAIYLYGGSIVDGDIHVKGTLVVDESMVNNGRIVLSLIEGTNTPMLTGYSMMTGNRALAADISDASEGSYALADDADSFDGELTLMSGNSVLGTMKGTMATLSSSNVYELDTADDTVSLNVTESLLPSDSAQILWEQTAESSRTFQCSNDGFAHTLSVAVDGNALDCYALAEGEGAYRVMNETAVTAGGDYTVTENTTKRYVSDSNGSSDLFFANGAGEWGRGYAAEHQGILGGWTGTGEQVDLAGKNQITDVFEGSSDANILVMTDDVNGDALFVDDIYSAFPDEEQARIAQINEIRAGQGDDVVDMTSQRFAYIGDGLVIRGGAGDDTIWANSGSNKLFGDAGNDRIVGASGNDVIAGGAGDDSMHGGGGEDIFCFCTGWGTDTVEQLSSGTVTLWFTDSSGSWDESTKTYTQGENSVKVTGVATVTLKFGDDGSELYDSLVAQGCFMSESSEKIWETTGQGTGIIASL